MSLDKGGLTGTTITDKDELECRNLLLCHAVFLETNLPERDKGQTQDRWSKLLKLQQKSPKLDQAGKNVQEQHREARNEIKTERGERCDLPCTMQFPSFFFCHHRERERKKKFLVGKKKRAGRFGTPTRRSAEKLVLYLSSVSCHVSFELQRVILDGLRRDVKKEKDNTNNGLGNGHAGRSTAGSRPYRIWAGSPGGSAVAACLLPDFRIRTCSGCTPGHQQVLKRSLSGRVHTHTRIHTHIRSHFVALFLPESKLLDSGA